VTAERGGFPTAYITLGSAGSGKSTISRRISAVTGAVYLDKDVVAGPLVQFALKALGQDPTDRESNATYVERLMPLEYSTLFAVAGSNLELGHSVVLDAPFVAYLSDPEYLESAIAAAGWPRVHIRIIHVEAPREVVRRRLLDRGQDRDRAKLEDWDAYWARFGVLDCRWRIGSHDRVVNDGARGLSMVDALVGGSTAAD
jgi:predicted kinase